MKPNHIVRQSGGMLIETIAGVVILGAVAVGAAELMNRNLDDARAATAAQQLKMVADAVNTYVKTNAGAIAGVADNVTPVLITVGELSNAGLLPAGFSATNTYSQAMCAVVIEPNDPTTGQPNGRLQTLVITTEGEVLDQVTQATVVNTAGANAGSVLNANSIVGARNAWTLNPNTPPPNPINFAGNFTRIVDSATFPSNCGNSVVLFGAGHLAMALWLGNANGGLNQDVLYRVEVPGMEQLNDMQTTLRVAGTETRTDTAGSQAQQGIGVLVDNGGGNVQANRDIRANRDMIAGGDLTVNGDAKITGNLEANTLLATLNSAEQDVPCPSGTLPGTLATNTDGKLYSCINGLWNRVGGMTRNYTTISSDSGLGHKAISCGSLSPYAKLIGGSCYSTHTNMYGVTSALWSTNGYPHGNSWQCPVAAVSLTSTVTFNDEIGLGPPIPKNINVDNSVIPAITTAYAVCEIPD